jgi:cytochrome c oxidase cbb3-type subunit 3
MTGLARSCLLHVTGALVVTGLLPGCERGTGVERATTPPGATGQVSLKNPLGPDQNTGTGQQLFTWFNCAGCHGARGGGGIGPPLRDKMWIYGSDPASIYQSIAQGRPNGMPAFGGKIPDEQIWSLEMYIRSLGGADPPVPAGGSSGVSPTRPASR